MDPQTHHGMADHVRIVCSGGEPDKCAAKQIDHRCGKYAPQHFYQQHFPEGFPDAVIFLCAPILTHKGGICYGKRGFRLNHHHKQLSGSCMGGNIAFTQQIVCPGEDHAAAVHQAAHQRHGDTGGEEGFQHFPRDPEILLPGKILPIVPQHINAAQDRRGCLGKHRRNSRACDPHLENHHKEDIQHNV